VIRHLHTVPPVVVLVVAWGAGLFAAGSMAAPVRITLPQTIGMGVVLASGRGLILWAAREFRRYRTSIWPLGRPTFLFRSGLFGWSRNPVYLGMAILCLGPLVVTGSLASTTGFMLFVGFIHTVTIPFEETRLAARFPHDFAAYRREVPVDLTRACRMPALQSRALHWPPKPRRRPT
jgi:protein-S-isoprenylcysteine O-methyltransferase Ste14